MKIENDIITDNGDLDFVDGDFRISISNAQNFEDLMYSVFNDYKYFGQIGVNLNSFLNSPFTEPIEQTIKTAMELDNWQTNDLKVSKDLEKDDIKINTNCNRK